MQPGAGSYAERVIRERRLPAGWYPRTAEEVREQCDSWVSGEPSPERSFRAVVVPHAGWYFSGSLAYRTIRRLRADARVVVVAGGHLHPDDPVHVIPEDAVATPFGALAVDAELRDRVSRSLSCVEDRAVDNTVEIQLPLVAAVFGSIPVLCLRSPPSRQAAELGAVLAGYARETGRSVVVIGSTDLTHYGASYGFSPHGEGAEAVRWVRETNDARFLEALTSADPSAIVRRAVAERSACSSGAAATAAAFARGMGPVEVEIVGYHTSFDVMPNDSFVGYVGAGFRVQPGPQADSFRK